MDSNIKRNGDMLVKRCDPSDHPQKQRMLREATLATVLRIKEREEEWFLLSDKLMTRSIPGNYT